MTEEQEAFEAIRKLRKAGFAVAIFTPSELQGIEEYASSLEEGLVADGNDRIDLYRELAEERRGA